MSFQIGKIARDPSPALPVNGEGALVPPFTGGPQGGNGFDGPRLGITRLCAQWYNACRPIHFHLALSCSDLRSVE
jgi:hypothetical protein